MVGFVFLNFGFCPQVYASESRLGCQRLMTQEEASLEPLEGPLESRVGYRVWPKGGEIVTKPVGPLRRLQVFRRVDGKHVALVARVPQEEELVSVIAPRIPFLEKNLAQSQDIMVNTHLSLYRRLIEEYGQAEVLFAGELRVFSNQIVAIDDESESFQDPISNPKEWISKRQLESKIKRRSVQRMQAAQEVFAQQKLVAKRVSLKMVEEGRGDRAARLNFMKDCLSGANDKCHRRYLRLEKVIERFHKIFGVGDVYQQLTEWLLSFNPRAVRIVQRGEFLRVTSSLNEILEEDSICDALYTMSRTQDDQSIDLLIETLEEFVNMVRWG